MKQYTSAKEFRNVVTVDDDYYVCEMCGEPPYSNGDGSMQDIGYCTECKDYTDYILISEFMEKDNDN